jgi:hypothetical protein
MVDVMIGVVIAENYLIVVTVETAHVKENAMI